MKFSKLLLPLMASVGLISPNQVWANDLLEHYRSQLADNPAGVYEANEHVYFVTDVQCLEDKKSAGSVESKRAETLFYKLLAQEVQQRSVSLESSQWSSLPIFEAVEYSLKVQSVNQIQVPYQLLSDSNLENCTRRQVRVARRDSFEHDHVRISHQQVAQAVGDAISQLVAENNFEQLALQLSSDAFPEVGALYRTLSEATDGNPNQEEYRTVTGIDNYDINGVLSRVKAIQGKQLAPTIMVNELAGQHWLTEADKLFQQGRSPEHIQRFLTLSLNANPLNHQAWKTLSNLTRAVSKDDALWTARQYFLVSGGSLDAWVYLYKALEVTSSTQAEQLHKLLKQIATQWSLNDWELSQIKG